MEKELISFVTSKKGDQVFVHLDKAGINRLILELERLKSKLEKNQCDDVHLFSDEWSGDGDLSGTKLSNQPGEDVVVHQVNIYGWTDEWKIRNRLST